MSSETEYIMHTAITKEFRYDNALNVRRKMLSGS